MKDMSELIKGYVEGYAIQNLNTCLPARIISVDKLSTEQTIDVKADIYRRYKDGVVVESPVIYNVPVVFPAGGGGIMTFPLAVDETVMIMFSQRSMDEWLEGAGLNAVSPADSRNHHRTDAIAIPSIFTKQNNLTPSATDVELKFGTSSISISPEDVVTISDGVSSIIMNGSGGVDISSSTLTHNGINIGDDHVHGGVETGPGSTSGPS